MVKPLRLLVLGGTGRIGWELLAQGRLRGHRMTAFVRSPEKLEAKLAAPDSGLEIVRGEPRSIAQLEAVVPNHNAVLSALGPADLGKSSVLRDCAASIVAAMKFAEVRRLLVVSAAMLFRDAGLAAAILRGTILRNAAEDSREMERIVSQSGLDWTIARPPRLTEGPLTSGYRIADGVFPKGKASLARSDVAHFLLDEVERGQHVQKVVGLAG
jgi:putative NADH-flavin reductase